MVRHIGRGWIGAADVTVEVCFAVPARERGHIAMERNDTVEFLRRILTQARAQGFAERTLRRAKKQLDVRAVKEEGGDGS